MQLTIGMIVKNEESRLGKCLSSIKPILDNVDSELIITDTGSTDRTIEIAKQYTDKVLHFDWCDDFSAARNTAFETAKGEWFMFVDADDVFTDCGDLISFFNSSEGAVFGSASFTYRNIRSADKSEYIDQYVIRIVRRFPQTHFVGRIHEVLDPMPEPIKALGMIVEHYGYFYDSADASTEKMKRNERILLKEISESPIGDGKNVLLYYYLYQEVRESDPMKAEKYLDEGIETALAAKVNTIIPLIHEKIRIRLNRKEYDAAIELCDEYFGHDVAIRNGELCADTEVYAAKAIALQELGRYSEACDAFSEFFRLYDLVNSGTLATGDRYIYLPALSGDGNFGNMLVRYIDCLCQADSPGNAENFLATYPFRNYLKNDDAIGLFPGIAILMKNQRDISSLLPDENDAVIVIASLCCDHSDAFFDTAGNYNTTTIRDNDTLPRAALFYEACINKALSREQNIKELTNRFTDIGKSYTGNHANDSINLAVIIGQAENALNSGQYRECLALLKDALQRYSRSADMIRTYIDIVSAELKRSTAASPASEMEKLAATVKSNIRNLIAAGNTSSAEKLLGDYSKIAPGDPEIDELRKLIQVSL